MEQSLFSALAAHGLPGLVIFGLAAWIVLLHRELRDERVNRIKDVKEYTNTLIEMHTKVLNGTERLTDTMSGLKEVSTDLKDVSKELRERGARRP